MNNNLFVVVMAGGIGTRLWPYSRNSKPKQFLDVLGTGKTLLQSTYERFLPVCPRENIFVVTNDEHVALTREQIPDIQPDQLLAEPVVFLGRTVAPVHGIGLRQLGNFLDPIQKALMGC